MRHIIRSCTLLVLLYIDASCGGGNDPTPASTCTSSASSNSKSVNFFDNTVGSPFRGQAVATFQFKQQLTSYTGSGCGGKSLEASNTLAIQNATSKTMKLDYNVNYSLNAYNWNYQGIATVAPNTSFEVGEINTVPGSISLGTITVTSKSITYQ